MQSSPASSSDKNLFGWERRDRAAILIVDDRPDKLMVYQTILECLGQDLFTAASGEQALKQVLERDFAVILLDVNMPGLDGIETAGLIRKRRRSAHIPIIFITADFNDDSKARGYALGAVDYIASPLVPEILRAKVKVFVDLYLLGQQAQLQAQERIALAEEKAARATAEQASLRLSFLARASETLAASLDPAAITHELADLCVPFLADICMLTLCAGRESCGSTEVAWIGQDPEQGVLRHSLAAIDMRWLDEAIGDVLKSGRPTTFGMAPIIGAAARAQIPLRASDIGASDDFAITGLVIVPLSARGRTAGALLLGVGRHGREFDADALPMATNLAGRGAMALDNALLYAKIQGEDRRKDEFLAMLAHELRNPLAPIRNAVHILQSNGKDAAKREWATDVIGRQLKQVVRLVDDLLDVSRITRGKIDLKIEAIDASKVVAAAVETSRPLVDSFEHTLNIVLPPEPLKLKGDFTRVAQILANLINNAAKYTDRRGHISITAAREEAQIVFRVRDTGIGIPHGLLDTIFEPFAQINKTLDRAQGGLGVGLTLVRRLVELQGGRVSAFSDGPNRGSEFTVSLPAADLATSAQRRSEGVLETAELAPNLRVLVVDDNHDAAESTAALLRLEGCEVHVAHDGEETLRVVRQLRPSAILLDIGLPKINGFEVAERIRAEAELRDTLIIGVSGYGHEQHRLRSKQAGFDHHIVKPIEPSVLVQLLSSVCLQPSFAKRKIAK